MHSRLVLRALLDAGWTVVRVTASHHQLKHERHRLVVTLPHPKGNLTRGLVRAIERQTGLTIWP
jgi:predicted RNA binding protein YcfA (HicA-like mRNA interferase family)